MEEVEFTDENPNSNQDNDFEPFHQVQQEPSSSNQSNGGVILEQDRFLPIGLFFLMESSGFPFFNFSEYFTYHEASDSIRGKVVQRGQGVRARMHHGIFAGLLNLRKKNFFFN